MSEALPLRPVTEKLPLVVMYILPVVSIQISLICSVLMVPNPTSEPSKYMAHDPLVVVPRDVAAKETRSSLFPETPVTLKGPTVLTIRLPLGAKLMASISSSVVVSPTSEPSKYIVKVPAVFDPREVGVKRTISEALTLPMPDTIPSASRLSKMDPFDINSKASTSLVMPTSEPSKYMDQPPVALLRDKISSSAKETLPTVPSVVELT